MVRGRYRAARGTGIGMFGGLDPRVFFTHFDQQKTPILSNFCTHNYSIGTFLVLLFST